MSLPSRLVDMSNFGSVTPDEPKVKRLIFLALARDCEHTLSRVFALCDEAERQGFEVRCKIGENGSTDGTRAQILNRARVDKRVSFVATEAMADNLDRLQRMAVGRELLRVAWLEERSNDDFVCVVDVDGVLPEKLTDSIDLSGAAAALEADSTLAGVSASSAPFYYDLLALRVERVFNFDIGPSLRFGKVSPLFHYLIHANIIYPAQKRVTSLLPLQTISSFNGMTLYRADDYMDASYLASAIVDECEHVALNRQICGEDRRILAGEWFKLTMPQEHGPRGALGFFVQRMLKVIRK